ncbi:MAG: NHLP bacteriocin system secretion protein [Betaproteobacteria bacterium]
MPAGGWIALGSIALIVVSAALWSFLGTVPTKVASRCIVMSASGVAAVIASASGRVLEVSVKPGDAVRAGQTIGAIAQPELDDRIRRARARIAELEDRGRSIATLSRRGLELSEDALLKRGDFLRQQRLLAQSRVRIAEEQGATLRQLLEQGLVTRRAVDDATRERKASEITVRDLERQIADLERTRVDTRKRESDERSGVELELADARRELALLESDRRRSTAVVSPFEGRVIEIKAGRGMLVNQGAPMVSLERGGALAGPLEVVMYVAAADGKKIAAGAEAHVLPATVQREERGHLLGEVRSVSDYPATPQSLLATLGNEELVREVASLPAPFEVRVDLRRDGERYMWSRHSSDPPPLQAGTLCRGEVLVRKERPAGFVIPALRKEVI